MASSDIEPLLNSQPPNLPFNVARVTADGRPTQYMIDWENFSSNWFRSNIIKTDQRIDTVSAAVGDVSAAVTTEANARIAADEALAEQITEVSASVDDATANGQIYFGAMAGPAGSLAAYGVFLPAGNTYAGMQIIAESGGGASIGFAANDFRLVDSGTAQNVFNYSSGVFTFNVPVRVGTVDIANQAVNAPVAAQNSSIYQLGADIGWQTLVSCTATGVAGGVALIHLDFEYFKQQVGSHIVGGEWKLECSDGSIPAFGFLGTLAGPSYFPVTISRLDTNFQTTKTYYLLVRAYTSSGTGGTYFEFRTRSIMIDMRKR